MGGTARLPHRWVPHWPVAQVRAATRIIGYHTPMPSSRELDADTLSRWSEAAHVRRSRRAYREEPISGRSADDLEAHCSSFAPFAGARVVLLPEAPAEIFTGWLLGVYGKVASPSALVFVGDRRLPDAAARAGYAGEAAVLEATALGFATCWIGGGVRREAVKKLLTLSAEEHVYSISALGYSPDHPTAGERATAGMVRAHARKPLSKLAPGSAGWPHWARRGVELARLAPSATNRQPWRFALEVAAAEPDAPGADGDTPVRFDGRGERTTPEPGVLLHFEGRDTPVISKRLDCGIGMLHFELGARTAGADGSWSLLEGNQVARWESR